MAKKKRGKKKRRIKARVIVSWIAAGLLALGFAAFNVVAYNQARAMMRFVDSGARTPSPEELHGTQKLRVLLKGINMPKPVNERDPSDLPLAYNVHHVAVTNGPVLEAWELPRDDVKGVVILFHGYAVAKATLLDEAKALHDKGFACWLVDFRGCGGSTGDETSVGYLEAEDVRATVQYVREHVPEDSRIVLYGQSMGAAAVLRAAALDWVQPKAIVCEAVFDRLLVTARNRFKSMGIPPFPSAEALVFWGGRRVGFSAFSHNPVDYARQVTCPVLMLHGENDPRATLAQAQSVYAALGQPKRFVSFPEIKHESCYTADPALWVSSIAGFLGDL